MQIALTGLGYARTANFSPFALVILRISGWLKAMRTHAEIIRDAGGWRAVRDALAMPTDDAKVKFWFFRDSIPCEYWKALADLGIDHGGGAGPGRASAALPERACRMIKAQARFYTPGFWSLVFHVLALAVI